MKTLNKGAQNQKNPISLTRPDQNTQATPILGLNCISPSHNTPHKFSPPHPQQHSPSPPLEETLAILRTISPGDLRGYKEMEFEPKQQKLQQYAGLMDVIEKFHEIMKLIIEKEKKKTQCHVTRIVQIISEQRRFRFHLSIQEQSPNTSTKTQGPEFL
ncbi:MAG: hypothetical protein EZS28_007212 [Streblomastix strix]|uniref:Uncharacterized protein n=1 Tax=Streblomastix strix TaxID=222440 RepID=A0A5J4WQR6_9EUKA|nr:MAG: hypothetical protein EZS28_007212 [Streblomastix strix]